MNLQQLRNKELSLNELQIDSLVSLLGKGCIQSTKGRLRSILTYSFSSLPSKWYWERLEVSEVGNCNAKYCAGQDYTSEIASIRNNIVGK
jgi:hypothetical protein